MSCLPTDWISCLTHVYYLDMPPETYMMRLSVYPVYKMICSFNTLKVRLEPSPISITDIRKQQNYRDTDHHLNTSCKTVITFTQRAIMISRSCAHLCDE